jgi:hypothetical protein
LIGSSGVHRVDGTSEVDASLVSSCAYQPDETGYPQSAAALAPRRAAEDTIRI